jgi:hypothetical protein
MTRILQRRAVSAKALAGSALGVSALLVGACLATPALASAKHPGGTWSTHQQVPKIASSLAPAETTSGSTWYVAFTTAKGGIDYAIHTTSWWTRIRTVSGKSVTPMTGSSPAVIVFNKQLYVFWINSGGQIRYTHLQGKTWAATKNLSGSWGSAQSSTTPSLAVASGDLWVVYKGHSTDNIYYTSTSGSTWNRQQVVVKNATSYSPAVAPTGLSAAPVTIAWTESSGAIGYGIVGLLGFESIGTVPQAGTNAAPALGFMSAAPGETMYLAWKGTSTSRVFFDDVTDFSDSSFGPSSWAGQSTLPNAFTSAGPAINDIGTKLYAVYKSHTSDSIYYESATNPHS